MEGVSCGQIGKAPAIIDFAVPKSCTSVSQLNVSRSVELHDLAAQHNIQSSSHDRESNLIRVCSLVYDRFTDMALEGALSRGRFHVNAPIKTMNLVPVVCRRRGRAKSYQQQRREAAREGICAPSRHNLASPHGTTKWTIKAAAIMRIRKPAAARITVSRMKLLPKGTPAGRSKLRPGPSKPGNTGPAQPGYPPPTSWFLASPAQQSVQFLDGPRWRKVGDRYLVRAFARSVLCWSPALWPDVAARLARLIMGSI
jgi:hypothetical protein